MEDSIWKLKISGTTQPNRSCLTHCNAALSVTQGKENWPIYLRIQYLEEPPCKSLIERQLWILHNKQKSNRSNKQPISRSKKRFPKWNRNLHHNNQQNLKFKSPKMNPFKQNPTFPIKPRHQLNNTPSKTRWHSVRKATPAKNSTKLAKLRAKRQYSQW